MSWADLRERSKLTSPEFDKALGRPGDTPIGAVKEIARALGVPEFAIYAQPDRIQVGILPDFRRPDAPVAELSSLTYKIIDSIKALRSTAAAVGADIETPLYRISTTASPTSAASEVRRLLGLDFEEQVRSKDARAFYAQFRLAVENAGVFVLQDSFPSEDGSGFSMSGGGEPAIVVVNTKSATIPRRIFTLAHEIFHVARRETGVSGVFHSSAIERRCDEFAANLLLPDAEFRAFLSQRFSQATSYLHLIQRISSAVKVSQQAVALRISELGIEPSLYRSWLEIYGDSNPDTLMKRGGGRGEHDENKVKLAKYGFRFADVFDRAIGDGSISHYALYELSGLKRDYSTGYFGYARSVSQQGITDNVFEDED